MRTVMLLTVGLLGIWIQYGAVRAAQPVYEDVVWLTESARLPAVTGRRVLTAVRHPPSYQLTELLYDVETHAGMSLARRHLHNVLLHLVVGLGVGLLAWQVTGVWRVLPVLVFWWCPIQTEAVAYLAGRSEAIAALGILIACLSIGRRSWWGLRGLGVGIGLLLAMNAKPSGLVALPLVIGYALWQHWRVVALRRSLVVGILGLAMGILLLPGVQHLARWGQDLVRSAPHHWHVLSWIGMQSVALIRLAALVVWPQGFTVDHDYDVVPTWVVVVAMLIVAGVVSAAVRQVRTQPIWAGAVLWVLCALGTRFLIPYGEFLGENKMYIPMIGISIAVAQIGVPRRLRGFA